MPNKLLQKARRLKKKKGSRFLDQIEDLETLDDIINLFNEEEKQKYNMMCEKLSNLELLKGDDLAFVRFWKNQLAKTLIEAIESINLQQEKWPRLFKDFQRIKVKVNQQKNLNLNEIDFLKNTKSLSPFFKRDMEM